MKVSMSAQGMMGLGAKVKGGVKGEDFRTSKVSAKICSAGGLY